MHGNVECRRAMDLDPKQACREDQGKNKFDPNFKKFPKLIVI